LNPVADQVLCSDGYVTSSYWQALYLVLSGSVPVCRGHAEVLLVEALRYKPGGCGFDTRWDQ